MTQPFLVTHDQDAAAARDSRATKVDIIQQSNVLMDRVIKEKHMPDKPKPSFKPAVHASLPYVDKAYKALLSALAVKNKRTQKSELELSISERAERQGITNA